MRSTTIRVALGVCWLAVLASFVGCSSKPHAATGVSQGSLTGKTFDSTSITGHDLVAGTMVTLMFDGATLSASAGCNTMAAGYTVDNSTLRWAGEPRSTLLGCDPALSAQDHWLAMFLQAGATASLSGSRLTLTGSATVLELRER